jgi:hypothetical protein
MKRPLTGPTPLLPLLAGLLLLLPAAAAGQERDTVPLPAAPPPAQAVVEPPAPSLDEAAEAAAVTAAAADTLPPGYISPRTAFLRSLVLPGWGQSSLGAPGRGSIYFALEAGSLWMTYKSHRKLREAERGQAVLRELGQLPLNQRTPLVRDRRAQREDWITLSVFFLFFSGADAFVAAHLQDFEERVEVRPTAGGGVELRASVPLSAFR